MASLVEKGFDFHHAKPGVLVLLKWLPEDEVNNVPQYPFTFIGKLLCLVLFFIIIIIIIVIIIIILIIIIIIIIRSWRFGY